LAVEFHVGEEAMSFPVPPLIVQPLVENAVVHGIMKKLEGGTVTVTIQRAQADMEAGRDRLRCTVQDTGVGMDRERIASILTGQQEGRGIGLQNIHSRL